jgi:hypothetical protein
MITGNALEKGNIGTQGFDPGFFGVSIQILHSAVHSPGVIFLMEEQSLQPNFLIFL